ncbi:zinc finger protein 782 [Trichonephila clavipes]|nr:zinc finger protein 782 [Trichonephila clavipes]
METSINLQDPNVEYVDAICLDKSIILADGCTAATITTVDGEPLPLTFIVSQPLARNENRNRADGEIITSDVAATRIKTEEDSQETDDTSVYTVHFPNKAQSEESSYLEQQENDLQIEDKSVVMNEENSMEQEILISQPDIDSLTSVSRLEDFMDVVTTYKCKFCRFSCPWKSGLMSHIRYCHIKEKNSMGVLKPDNQAKSECLDNRENEESVIDSKLNTTCEKVTLDSDSSKVTSEETAQESVTIIRRTLEEDNERSSSPISALNERHIFLCGQCSDGFASLEECKQHMINDHNLKLAQDNEKSAKGIRSRPRKRRCMDDASLPKRPVKKEAIIKETTKKKRNILFKNLEDELDCCIKRKLRTGYVNDRAFR